MKQPLGLLSSLLLLLVWLPTGSVARSAAASAASRPLLLQTLRGGGRNSNSKNDHNDYSFDIDSIGSFVSAASNIFVKEVAPILQRESKNAAKFAKDFLEQQKNNAAERRKQYREQAGDLGKTASTLADPIRAAKLTFASLLIAEALQYVDGEGFALDDLSDLAAVAADNILFQAENFFKVGRQPGGLLRAGTWTSRSRLFAAIQKQVNPKYQWAMGAALGFVISPVLWSLGWKAFGGFAVVYLLAEGHNVAKRTNSNYFTFLKATENPVIFFIDGILEDVRDFVEAVKIDPKGTLFAMRDRIDARIDLDLECPPELQRGLLFGAFAGVLTGV